MSRTNLILTIVALLGLIVFLGSLVGDIRSSSAPSDEGSEVVTEAEYTYSPITDPRNCPVGQNYEDKCYYATTEASNEGSLVSIVEDIIQKENLEDDPETLGISVIFYHPSGDPLAMAYAFRDDVNGEFDVSLEEPTDPN